MTDAPTHSTQMGKYRLLGELGRGGMAQVYLALVSGPAGFNKLLVIKRIQSELASDPDFVTMFLDEARLAARLNHPNVVQTNEVGQDGTSYFIAMEYLEGQTFRRVLSRLGRGQNAPLTVGMQLRVLVDALHGLHYAHDLTDFDGTPLNVVHRDISPDNIFVTYTGQVKVVDFGIAKALGSTTKTQTGMIKGKVSYMSPEHACGEAVDRRSDVFSMGVILWEVATGQRLFSGMPDIAVLHRLTSNNIPRPGTVNSAVDERLEAIVMKAMAYEAHDRYQSAGELAHALEQLLYEWGEESSCRDVGALAAAHFAEDRERVRALIERQVQTIEAAPPTAAAPLPLLQLEQTTGSGASAIAPASPPAPTAEPATALTASNTVMTPGVARPSRGTPKGLVLGVLAASAVVGGVAAFFVLSSPVEATGAAAPTSEPAPAASVTLRIDSEPADAEVRCGDRDMGPTPVVKPVQAGVEISCTVSREGYQPKQLELGKLDSDYREKVTLVPVASAEPTAEPSETSAPPRYTGGRPPPPPPTTATTPAKKGGGDIRLTR